MLDGVALTITANGDHLDILYIDPPVLLREAGAKKDSPVLSGEWVQGVLVGDAYVYAPNCGAISYPIRGVVDAFDNLVIVGPTPKLREGSCEVIGHEWTDRAVFKLGSPLKTQQPAVKQKKAKPKKKAEPKPKPRPRSPRAAPQQQPQPQQWWWRW